jgi:predicted signal transduction protein with EAL and GGDEF domain
MFNGPDETALLRSILQLSDTLHLETVAEGIEEARQLTELRASGATMGQGYFFARPISPDAIATLLGTADGHVEGSTVPRRAARPSRKLGPTKRARSGRSATPQAPRAGG